MAQPPAPAAVDYAKSASWLCQPGQKDACSVNLDATVITAYGSLVVEKWQANAEAPIDGNKPGPI